MCLASKAAFAYYRGANGNGRKAMVGDTGDDVHKDRREPRDGGQVTAIIRRCIVEDGVDEYTHLSDALNTEARKFEGYRGTRMIYPDTPDGEYVTIFSFDSYDHYELWQQSERRHALLTQMEKIVRKHTAQHFTGVDYWFEGSKRSRSPQFPSWRMVLVVFAAIFPLVYFLPPIIDPFLPSHPFWAIFVSAGITTLLMSYVSLPLMAWLFQRWLD